MTKPRVNSLTQKDLKELLIYNTETGIFTWRVSRYRAQIGDVAGHLNKSGYYTIRTGKKHYRVHRLVWLYVYGFEPQVAIDHINGDKSDNRLCNLREANKSQNGMNTDKRVTNTSGFKGVSFHKASGKWVAQAKLNYKHYYLGLYTTPEEASEVYQKFCSKYHGEFYNPLN